LTRWHSFCEYDAAVTGNPQLTRRLKECFGVAPRLDDAQAGRINELLREIWPELYRVAGRELKRKNWRFEPYTRTELIHEMWAQHLAKGKWQIEDRKHFFALVGTVMRHVLMDSARKRLAKRRGSGEVPESLDDPDGHVQPWVRDDRQTIEIGILVERMEQKHQRAAQVFNLSYFGGWTLEEIAAKLELSEKQARTALADAKKLLAGGMRAGARRQSQAPASSADEASKSRTMGSANNPAAGGLLPGSNS
jgi:RNA polymerase sigma factor (TIGR02999 family)